MATPAQPSYAELWAPQSLERATRGQARRRAASWAATCLAVDGDALTAVVAAQLGASWAGSTRRRSSGWSRSLRSSSPRSRSVACTRHGCASNLGRPAPGHRLTTVAAMAAISAWTLLGAGAGQAGQVARMWAFAVVYIAAGRARSTGRKAERGARSQDADSDRRSRQDRTPGHGAPARRARAPGLQPIGFPDNEPLDDG